MMHGQAKVKYILCL